MSEHRECDEDRERENPPPAAGDTHQREGREHRECEDRERENPPPAAGDTHQREGREGEEILQRWSGAAVP
jgi:hypothetical protein